MKSVCLCVKNSSRKSNKSQIQRLSNQCLQFGLQCVSVGTTHEMKQSNRIESNRSKNSFLEMEIDNLNSMIQCGVRLTNRKIQIRFFFSVSSIHECESNKERNEKKKNRKFLFDFPSRCAHSKQTENLKALTLTTNEHTY